MNGVICVDRERCDACCECEAVCSSGARKVIGREMTVFQVLEEVRKDKPFYDRSKGGVTLGGGEPTVWAGFARDLLRLCIEEQIDTAIETCGFVSWDKLSILLPFTNLFLYDLKCMDDELHRRYTGVSNKLILENLGKLCKLSDNIIVRIPLVPGLNDSSENIEATALFVKRMESVKRIELLPYHRLGVSKYQSLGRIYKLDELSPPSDERMNNLRDIVLSYGIGCTIES
jgi:pyruvate formate lyase activating enzyme